MAIHSPENQEHSNPQSMHTASHHRKMTLSTDAIGRDGNMDPRYTCDLDNSSPELRWDNAPHQTAGFALMVEDSNAPSKVFTHWLIYRIPPEIRHLPTGIPPQESLPNGIQQGINSFGKLGYSGPCPPQHDSAHQYHFRLFALKKMPPLSRRFLRDELLHTIRPLILESTEVIGLYRRLIQRAG